MSGLAKALVASSVALALSSIGQVALAVTSKTVEARTVIDGTEWTISIETIPANARMPHYEERWWGAQFERPESIVGAISLSRAGARIAVPLSAFADLANVTGVSIDKVQEGVRITIRGAQTGESYQAELLVLGSRLAKRELRLGEFIDTVLQRTEYFQSGVQ